MKKFTALAFAVLLLMFVASCGSDKKTEEKLPDSEVTDEDAVDDEPADTTPDGGDTTPNEGDTTPDGGDTTPDGGDTAQDDADTTPDEGDTAHDGGDTAQDDADTNTNDDDADSGAVIDDADSGTNDDDADNVLPDEDSEQETGSCTYIPNSFVSDWTDDFPTDWVNRYVPSGDKKNLIAYEKIDRGEGDYALRAYISATDAKKNNYAFELPPFVPADDAALPIKATFVLKTNKTSRMSINLRCGEHEKPQDDVYFPYNFEKESKTFEKDTQNQFKDKDRDINLTDFEEITIVFGDEITKDFWQGHKCRFEFKYGKEFDFDVVIDNFVLHTAAGACDPEDNPAEENDDDDTDDQDDEDIDDQDTDTEENDDEDIDDQDDEDIDDQDDEDIDDQDDEDIDDQDDEDPDADEPETQTCVQIPNGDFSGTWDSTTGLPEGWTKGNGTNMTFSQDANGAFRIQHTNGVTNSSDNKYAARYPDIVVPADADVPAGIRFQFATNIASLISINLRWGTGNDEYYAYNWDEASKAFVKGSQNAYNRVDFGDTNLHNVEIIFGSEMTETLWRGKTFTLEIKYGNRYKDNGTDWTYYNFDISVKNFEFVYYGGECNNVSTTYTVGYAGIQSPTSVEGYVGMTETFYGKLWIDNLTNLTYNQTVYLMGVKGQFGVKKKDEPDDAYVWYDAEPNVKNTTLGNDDEYMYKNYIFPEVGDFEYTFRFSTDNGNTWPLEAMAESKQAKILALPEGQIANGDFKYWLSDNTTPQLWTHEDTVEFSKWNDAETLKVKATGSKKYVLVSPEFELSSTAKAISFKMAMSEGIEAAFFIICDGTTKQYQWDSESHKFVKGSNYNTINFTDNSVLNETSIQAEAGTLTGTCYFKFRIDTSSDIWVAFDDFTVVYE